MTKKIITIEPSKINSNQTIGVYGLKKRRVAGYVRVSTDCEDQTTSYEAQMAYYQSYIESRNDWEFIKMYSDEGISGTSTKKRIGFQEMIEDALHGKIDLIITKSVSRFARNTVDSLSTVRALKEEGVEIYFEKENIWTLDSKGELLITIMSSLAQEESRSISENVKWSKRKAIAEGKVQISYNTMLGFKAGEDGKVVIDPEEASIVRYIFGLFLKGENPCSISRHLNEKGVPTPMGKNTWYYQTVKSILQNEKYKGDALLQKTFTVDYLTKKTKKNEGELPQYYVENNHEAIIDRETFDLVQLEIQNTSNRVPISYYGKVIWGCCGERYGRHVWHSNSNYRKYVFRCYHKHKGTKQCETPNVSAKEIESWVVQALATVLINKAELIQNLKILIERIEDTSTLYIEKQELKSQMEQIRASVETIVNQNAKELQNQQLYKEKYNSMVEAYQILENKLLEKPNAINTNLKKARELNAFIGILEKQEEKIVQFDKCLFTTLVDKVVVHKDKKIAVYLKNNQVITM